MSKIKKELKDKLVIVYQKRDDAHQVLLETDIELDILLRELFKTNVKQTKSVIKTGKKGQKVSNRTRTKHSN